MPRRRAVTRSAPPSQPSPPSQPTPVSLRLQPPAFRPRRGKPVRRPAFGAAAQRLADAAVVLARRRFSRRAGVLSVHWGLVRRAGRRLAQPGIVIFVRRKLPLIALSARAALPRSIDVSIGGRQRRVRIDVQSVGPAGLLLTGLARPGLSARVLMDADDGAPDGTLSAIVDAGHGDGRMRAILSGHVAATIDRPVLATTIAGTVVSLGTVERVLLRPDVDVAWTRPAPLPAPHLAIGPRVVRDPDKRDVRRMASILVAWDFEGRVGEIDDVDVTATFWNAKTNDTMTGLFTIYPAITTPGDSGAPVLDDDGQLIGFVVGASGDKTYAVPARRALHALDNS